MASNLGRALKIAESRLESGDRRSAQQILVGILKQDVRNAEAWYLLGRALPEPDHQEYAFRRVLLLAPEHERARQRLQALRGGQPEPAAGRVGPEQEPYVGSRSVDPSPTTSTLPAQDRYLKPAGTVPNAWERWWLRRQLGWRGLRRGWRAFSESSLSILGVAIILFFGLLAIAHPILMETVWPPGIYDPVTGFDSGVFPHPTLPGPGHVFGTDSLGRDVLSMLLAATTPTFVIGLTAALTTGLVATLLSSLAAYFRGPIDTLITNLADVFLLFPAPVIMIIVGARFRDLGPVPLGLIYGVVTGAGGATIVLRAHATQTISQPYMEAARIAGGGGFHIISRHLLPAMLPLTALQMMIAVTGAVVADGFISFFGLTRVTSNWGTIIYNAFVYSNLGAGTDVIWHVLLPAAVCFSLFALGFYLISRGLHRVASPALHPRR